MPSGVGEKKTHRRNEFLVHNSHRKEWDISRDSFERCKETIQFGFPAD